ncbi:uncharacterized protein [Haliotis cracherodii]|uniref:uncharacterized protein n=1 Tax=Haliotis cracherodii TaxID=6455 RepID=UPI0039E82DD7
MGDNMHTTFVSFVVLLISRWTLVGGNCSKFSSDGTLHKTVEVDGVCYYGFINNFQYSDAETLCSREWTKLPNFQNEATQEAVYAALGSQYGQHWLGLKKVSGTWQWWDPVSLTGAAMTSPRWEGGDSGDCAYSMTSNMGGMWKATSLTSAYNTVCQEAGVPATASESTTTTSAAVPTTSEAAPTTSEAAPSTPEAASSCSRTIYGGVEAARFSKRSTLIGVEETSLMTLTSATKCALVCVAQVSCCSFVFDVTTHRCRHFRPTFLGIDVIPTSSEKCYTVV